MRLHAKAALAGIATLAVAVPLAEGANKTVTVDNFKFSPASVSVKKGDTVTWRFQKDKAPHNAVGAGGIKSKTMATGTYKKTFRKAGTFKYACTLHKAMKGTVRVR